MSIEIMCIPPTAGTPTTSSVTTSNGSQDSPSVSSTKGAYTDSSSRFVNGKADGRMEKKSRFEPLRLPFDSSVPPPNFTVPPPPLAPTQFTTANGTKSTRSNDDGRDKPKSFLPPPPAPPNDPVNAKPMERNGFLHDKLKPVPSTSTSVSLFENCSFGLVFSFLKIHFML